MSDMQKRDGFMRRALGLVRDLIKAEDGTLGRDHIEEGYPEGAIPGENPMARQLRLAREQQKELLKNPYQDEPSEGKPPVK